MNILFSLFLSLSPVTNFNDIQGKVILVDLNNFKWYAIDDGMLIKQGPASGGRKGFKSHSGIYSILSKKGKYYRSDLYPEGCGNVKLKCAPMPYAIKYRHLGESLHGSNDKWDKLKHISHGCIHIRTSDAKWLNIYFADKETKIIILPY